MVATEVFLMVANEVFLRLKADNVMCSTCVYIFISIKKSQKMTSGLIIVHTVFEWRELAIQVNRTHSCWFIFH